MSYLSSTFRSNKTFLYFNINFFILTNLTLFILAITKRWLGLLNFALFFLFGTSLLLIYLLLRKGLHYNFLDVLFSVFLIINYLIIYLTLIFLREVIVMNYKLTDFAPYLLPFFVKNILGFNRFIIGLGILIILFGLSFYFSKKKIFSLHFKKPIRKGAIVFVFSVALLILIWMLFQSMIYNPYLNIFSSEEEQVGIPLGNSPNFSLDKIELYYNNNFEDYDLNNRKYKYAFVFVIEQTSLTDFYREISPLSDKNNFFERVKENTHFFTNYYSSNQDSRTAIWEMLNSFFIPMECYIEPWQEYYGYILNTNNLVEYLVNNGISPYSVSSVGGGSLILGIYPFEKFIRMYNYEDESKGYLCSTEFSYQKTCEDLAIFASFTNHIKENKDKNLFYFQEMIFGHGELYMHISGKSRTEYFNEYFNEFYNFLEDEALIDQSLIIIVSDHGPKGGEPRNPKDFNIPLMVISEDLNYQEIDTYYSHFSFKDIFLSYYTNSILPDEEKFIYLVDQSGRKKRGYVNVEQGFSILGELRDNTFFVNEKNLLVINISDIQEKMQYFQRYENYVKKLSLENHTYVYIP